MSSSTAITLLYRSFLNRALIRTSFLVRTWPRARNPFIPEKSTRLVIHLARQLVFCVSSIRLNFQTFIKLNFRLVMNLPFQRWN
jgi:hypothetical protein